MRPLGFLNNNKIVKTILLSSLTMIALLVGCTPAPPPEWTVETFIDAYGRENGVTLKINGTDLSNDLTNATVAFNNVEDMISGGYKEMFTITLDGKTSSSEITIITPDGKEHLFPCYDGLLFNADFDSNDIFRLMELMNYESLKFTQDNQSFTISTVGFLELYKEYFYQQQSAL